MKYYVGCSGWRNQPWTKDFYPVGLDSKYFLSYYSKVFDFVHVDLSDSSFLPSSVTLKNWFRETPDGFRFSLKMPQSVVEKRHSGDAIKGIGDFLEYWAPLEEKTLCVVISPPKSISLANGGREWLENTLNECTYHGYSVVFEFNHSSWYQDLTYNVLRRYKSVFAWSNAEYKSYYPAVTSDFVFLKLSGSAFEKNYNESGWINLIKQKEKELFSTRTGEKGIDFAVIVADAPSKINSILSLLDLQEKKWYRPQTQLPLHWSGRVIMHVDMNAFFPACEEIRDPSLKGKPHAVIMTPEKEGTITRGAVASCSYEARRYGVRSAMSLIKAKELCPGLSLKPVDKHYYSEISRQVMVLLEEYADVLEQTSIDEAYMDCTSKVIRQQQQQQQHKSTVNCPDLLNEEKEKELGTVENPDIDTNFSVEAYAQKIKDSIKQQCSGLLCSIGVAPTKSAAKIASDFKKPDGLTVVYSQNLLQFLGPLEVDRVAGIGIKTSQTLKEMGIKTIGQLAKCDVQKLIATFGKKNGLWMWHVANGEENEPVLPREDNLSLSTEQTLQNPTKDKGVILGYFLNDLVDDVYGRVKRRGYEFKTVGIKLMKTDFTVETRETTFPTYQDNKESIVGVLEPLLEKFNLGIMDKNKGYGKNDLTLIRKLGIKVSNLSKKDKGKFTSQKTLFDYL